MDIKRLFKLSALSSLLLIASCSQATTNHPQNQLKPSTQSLTKSSPGAINVSTETVALRTLAPSLNPKVIQLALTAYNNARRIGMDAKQVLTIIDYHQPDTQKRLYVFNLHNNTLLFNTLVAHGKNSGDVNATRFSNDPNSRESSLGLFLTSNSYIGRDGYAMRLIGLERGVNNNALSRAVVMHGARYVSEALATEMHRIGRSWGCPALSQDMAQPVINTIKNGTLVFSYAPDYSWLSHSDFLRA